MLTKYLIEFFFLRSEGEQTIHNLFIHTQPNGRRINKKKAKECKENPFIETHFNQNEWSKCFRCQQIVIPAKEHRPAKE